MTEDQKSGGGEPSASSRPATPEGVQDPPPYEEAAEAEKPLSKKAWAGLEDGHFRPPSGDYQQVQRKACAWDNFPK